MYALNDCISMSKICLNNQNPMEDVSKKPFETWNLKPNYKGALLLQHIKQAKKWSPNPNQPTWKCKHNNKSSSYKSNHHLTFYVLNK
jgi:hypothetical protein